MIKEYFKGIRDPRQKHKIKHNLLEIIVMVICAVVAECEAWYQIEHYCKTKKEWFKKKLKLKLKNGIPSHDTFERVFALIKPKELEKCFTLWINEIKTLEKGETVSIDGKTLCGSIEGENKAIHMVSAWANKSRLVLGQVKVNEKSNEITAIPELLDILEIEGCVVTTDAMGCQKNIAKKITENKAEYVLGLKGNQGNLRDDVELYFKDAQQNPDLYEPPKTTETLDKGHGRIEKRKYFLTTEIAWLTQKSDWSRLGAIGMVKSQTTEKGLERHEIRYFITSLTEIDSFAKATRQHWGIENSLHWILDVGFNEDKCRMRKDNSAQNFAVIRHIALNLLKQDDSKMSINSKRHRCAYDDDFLYKILFFFSPN